MDPDKASLRAALHARLRDTSEEERSASSADIRRHLLESDAWQRARTVMLFAALRYEPDLLPLVDNAQDRRLIFPALENDCIVPRAVSSLDGLSVAAHGIREPSPERCAIVRAKEIDLILVPGLGFGRDGTRLGRGRGHYDRFLATLPATAVRCGVCFGCQVSDTLPTEPHDLPVSLLVTENGVAVC